MTRVRRAQPGMVAAVKPRRLRVSVWSRLAREGDRHAGLHGRVCGIERDGSCGRSCRCHCHRSAQEERRHG
jgi:hypothetical protein